MANTLRMRRGATPRARPARPHSPINSRTRSACPVSQVSASARNPSFNTSARSPAARSIGRRQVDPARAVRVALAARSIRGTTSIPSTSPKRPLRNFNVDVELRKTPQSLVAGICNPYTPASPTCSQATTQSSSTPMSMSTTSTKRSIASPFVTPARKCQNSIKIVAIKTEPGTEMNQLPKPDEGLSIQRLYESLKKDDDLFDISVANFNKPSHIVDAFRYASDDDVPLPKTFEAMMEQIVVISTRFTPKQLFGVLCRAVPPGIACPDDRRRMLPFFITYYVDNLKWKMNIPSLVDLSGDPPEPPENAMYVFNSCLCFFIVRIFSYSIFFEIIFLNISRNIEERRRNNTS